MVIGALEPLWQKIKRVAKSGVITNAYPTFSFYKSIDVKSKKQAFARCFLLSFFWPSPSMTEMERSKQPVDNCKAYGNPNKH